MIEIVVPQIGEAVAELQITRWHKQEGDYVKKGDVLFEIDSDKSVLDVEAFVEGNARKNYRTRWKLSPSKRHCCIHSSCG